MGRNLPYSIRQSALYRGTFVFQLVRRLLVATSYSWQSACAGLYLVPLLRYWPSSSKRLFGFISRFPRFWQVNSGIFPQPYRPAQPANIDTEERTLPCIWKFSRLWGVLKLSRGKKSIPRKSIVLKPQNSTSAVPEYSSEAFLVDVERISGYYWKAFANAWEKADVGSGQGSQRRGEIDSCKTLHVDRGFGPGET